MKIKPKTCWAVISPDGVEVFKHERYWKCISSWLGFGEEKLTSQAVVGWVKATDQGYRCVRVELTAEEIE